jgi:hypothetical protein
MGGASPSHSVRLRISSGPRRRRPSATRMRRRRREALQDSRSAQTAFRHIPPEKPSYAKGAPRDERDYQPDHCPCSLMKALRLELRTTRMLSATHRFVRSFRRLSGLSERALRSQYPDCYPYFTSACERLCGFYWRLLSRSSRADCRGPEIMSSCRRTGQGAYSTGFSLSLIGSRAPLSSALTPASVAAVAT